MGVRPMEIVMEEDQALKSGLARLITAEAQNLSATMKALGSTVELTQDFQGLYRTLADLVRIPDPQMDYF